MERNQLSVWLSPLETSRFGVRTARAQDVTFEDIPAVLDFCAREDVCLLIARCPADDLRAAQSLEQVGGRLMDTLIEYRRDLQKGPIPEEESSVAIRSARSEDEEALRRLAAEAFRGYRGHYHADPRLDAAKADEAYVDWAVRSCRGELADDVLVAVGEGEMLLGFITLCANRSEEVEARLFAVSAAARGTGVSRALLVGALRWSRRRGARCVSISTQITNIAAQKAWVRVGFEPSRAHYTFHVWFD